jgi:putative transposase
VARFTVPEGWTAQAYRFALDLTPAQQRSFRSHAGGARKAYNTMLALVKAVMDQRAAERSHGIAEEGLTPALNWSLAGLRREWNRRKDGVAPWWAENSKECYSSGLDALARGLEAWSESRKGERAGRAAGFPRFKSARSRRSVRFTTGAIRVEPDRHHVTLPRLGRLKTHESTRKPARRIEAGTARILSASLSEDSAGRCHVSFQVLVKRSAAVPSAHAGPGAPVAGVDVGVKEDSLMVIAAPDGRETRRVPAPKSLTAAQGRLRALQRKAARQQGPWNPETRTRRQPPKRREKTNRRIGRTHAHAAVVRRDVLCKETTSLARRHEVITAETLNASGMRSAGGAHENGLNLALSDAALAEIRRMLGYKCAWYGSALLEAGRYFPSSKKCSGCGGRKPSLTLADRTYMCDHCGAAIDRDLNAAVNLARLGDAPRTGATGTGTGSSPAASHRAGNGRGATRETATTKVVNAAGDETSTRHDTVGKTGTAPPQGEAA